MEENQKRKNFKRIAESRVEKALDMLDLIGNLSNTSFYDYEDKEVEHIFYTLQESLNNNRKKFKKRNKNRNGRFTL